MTPPCLTNAAIAWGLPANSFQSRGVAGVEAALDLLPGVSESFSSGTLKFPQEREPSSFQYVPSENITFSTQPTDFTFLGNLQKEVLAAVPANIKSIQDDLPFVDFATIQDYACKHPRAARYLASIQAQRETKNVDKSALKKLVQPHRSRSQRV